MPNWTLDNCMIILHNGSRLYIYPSGPMVLEGNVKDAALGLVKYVVEKEYTPGLMHISFDDCLLIDFRDGCTISYTQENKPEFWDELQTEFNRIIKMRAFW